MNSKFERELLHIKVEYEKALEIVKNMGSNLKKMFSDKAAKIKNNCTSFFTRIDTCVE